MESYHDGTPKSCDVGTQHNALSYAATDTAFGKWQASIGAGIAPNRIADISQNRFRSVTVY